ncbi:hypothetical protein ABE41_008780 [Fictibacillus arsenicus]|uniref:Sulfotransferase family protein n=1 Tax=Fictibacillus arsenicus TaxID=255247 RepID=A0A1B1Z450_9BACL|nr:sulfotransferase family 2 domain-containing protein [Fictibacillus arsenicus]ANX12099.1 hypothetical protein ABE41_008780 [Fictibacillus arsenicus]
MAEKLLIFMHIPKSGGTTLNSIFRNCYKNNEIFDHVEQAEMRERFNRSSIRNQKAIKAVSGHHYYGVHEIFSKPFSYFTMMREPVNRVVSLYYFLKDYPGYYQNNMRNMSLEEYIEWDPQTKNGQSIQICGSQGNLTLEKAKENLKTFDVVGLTEMFNESLYLFKRKYGWKNINYTKKNITKTRPSIQEVPAHIVKKIEQQNQLDLEVYRLVKLNIMNQLNLLSPAEWEEIKKINA